MKTDELLSNQEKYYKKIIDEYGSSDYKVVNIKTGEYVDIPYGSTLKYPSLPKTNYNGNIIEKFQQKEMFIKVHKNPIEILGKELSNRDFAWFMRLIPYVRMYDCVLYDIENNKYLSIKDLSELMDVDYSNLKSVLKSFEDNGLIKKIKRPSNKDVYKSVNALAVNPFVLMNGEYVEKDIKELFINTKWSSYNVELDKKDKNH